MIRPEVRRESGPSIKHVMPGKSTLARNSGKLFSWVRSVGLLAARYHTMYRHTDHLPTVMLNVEALRVVIVSLKRSWKEGYVMCVVPSCWRCHGRMQAFTSRRAWLACREYTISKLLQAPTVLHGKKAMCESHPDAAGLTEERTKRKIHQIYGNSGTVRESFTHGDRPKRIEEGNMQ